jgi:hypothetical protein
MKRTDCGINRLDTANLSEHGLTVIYSTECNIALHGIHSKMGKYDVGSQNLRAKHEMKGPLS